MAMGPGGGGGGGRAASNLPIPNLTLTGGVAGTTSAGSRGAASGEAGVLEPL